MTTPAQAALYEVLHLAEHGDKPVHVFNPNDKPVEELPVIIGFCNGGQLGWVLRKSPGLAPSTVSSCGDRPWMEGVLIAQDGTILGGHICSSEAYMPHDLGILEGCRNDRHEEFKKHYPDGYRMEFVSYAKASTHEGLHAAMQLYVLANAPTPEVKQ